VTPHHRHRNKAGINKHSCNSLYTVLSVSNHLYDQSLGAECWWHVRHLHVGGMCDIHHVAHGTSAPIFDEICTEAVGVLTCPSGPLHAQFLLRILSRQGPGPYDCQDRTVSLLAGQGSSDPPLLPHLKSSAPRCLQGPVTRQGSHALGFRRILSRLQVRPAWNHESPSRVPFAGTAVVTRELSPAESVARPVAARALALASCLGPSDQSDPCLAPV
jgi:hypothetical protein